MASLGKNALRDAGLAKDADMLEIRLDLLEVDPIKAIRQIRGSSQFPLIATNRPIAEGGQFKGSEDERMDLLHQASVYADMVDIELCAPLRDEMIDKVGKPAIVSWHDFSGVPSFEMLKSMLCEISETDAYMAKLAVTPSRPAHNLAILRLLLDADMPLCIIAMGELGRHLRVFAPLYGSALTYGYLSEPTAPGQMSVSELRRALEILGPEIV